MEARPPAQRKSGAEQTYLCASLQLLGRLFHLRASAFLPDADRRAAAALRCCEGCAAMATEHRNGMSLYAGLSSPGPTYVLPSMCFTEAAKRPKTGQGV